MVLQSSPALTRTDQPTETDWKGWHHQICPIRKPPISPCDLMCTPLGLFVKSHKADIILEQFNRTTNVNVVSNMSKCRKDRLNLDLCRVFTDDGWRECQWSRCLVKQHVHPLVLTDSGSIMPQLCVQHTSSCDHTELMACLSVLLWIQIELIPGPGCVLLLSTWKIEQKLNQTEVKLNIQIH